MSRTSENGWAAGGHQSGDMPCQPDNDFRSRQSGKPMKTVIGVGLLAVVALVLSLMHPVPHDIPDGPSWTTGPAADPDAR